VFKISHMLALAVEAHLKKNRPPRSPEAVSQIIDGLNEVIGD